MLFTPWPAQSRPVEKLKADAREDRIEIIKEHYSLYQEVLNAAESGLSITVDGFEAYRATELVGKPLELLGSHLLQGEPGLIRLAHEPSEDSEYPIKARFHVRSKEFKEYVSLQASHFEQLGGRLIEGEQIQSLASFFESDEIESPELFELVLFDVSVDFKPPAGESSSFRYRAGFVWASIQEGSFLDYRVLDNRLEWIHDPIALSRFQFGHGFARPSERVAQGDSDRPGATRPSAVRKSGDGAECRPHQHTYPFPFAPNGHAWEYTPGFEVNPSWLGATGTYGHWDVLPDGRAIPHPGGPSHEFRFSPQLQCTCNSDCTSAAVVDSQTNAYATDLEKDFVHAWTSEIDGSWIYTQCHMSPPKPESLRKPNEIPRREDGGGAYGQDAIGWGVQECEDYPIGDFCVCDPYEANFGLNVGLPVDGAEIGLVAGVKYKVTHDEAEAWTVQAGLQCFSCIKNYRLSVTAQGMCQNEEVELTVSWDDDRYYEEGLPVPVTHSSIHKKFTVDGQDLDIQTSLRPSDGAEVVVLASTLPIGGQAGRACTPAQGYVNGGPLNLTINCSADGALENTACGAPTYTLDGTLRLDALGGGAIDHVTVTGRFTDPTGQVTSESHGPYDIAAGGRFTYPIGFQTEISEGWSYNIEASGQPTDVSCFSLGTNEVVGPVPPGGFSIECTRQVSGDHKVTGTLNLDANPMHPEQEQMDITGVEVTLRATPPPSTSWHPWTEKQGPYSATWQSEVDRQVSFGQLVPDGWTYSLSFNKPQDVECFFIGPFTGTAENDIQFTAKCNLGSGEPAPGTQEYCEVFPEMPECFQDATCWFQSCTVGTLVAEIAAPGHGETCAELYPSSDCPTVRLEFGTVRICDDPLPTDMSDCSTSALHSPNGNLKAEKSTREDNGPQVDVEYTFLQRGSSGTPQVIQGMPIPFAGTVSHPAGIFNVFTRLNGVTFEPAAWSFLEPNVSGEIDTSSLDPGMHVFEIFAYDNSERRFLGTVHEFSFEVVAPDPCNNDHDLPDVSFTPAGGKFAADGSAIPLTIQSSDLTSGVDRVRIFVNGAPNPLDPFRDPPPTFTHHWVPDGIGDYDVLVRAFDGCEKSSDVTHTLTVCDGPQAPSVNLISPAPADVLTAGQSVTLEAQASDDAEVDRVAFLDQNNTVLGVVGNSPYRLPWTATLGTTQIKARAYDGCGNQATSSVSVTVEEEQVPSLLVRLGTDYLTSGSTLDIGALTPGATNTGAANLWTLTLVARNHSEAAPLVTSVAVATLEGNAWHQGPNVLVPELGAFQEDSFAFRMWSDRPGVHRARAEITHNDPNIPNPFVINLVGEVEDTAPQMVVREAGGNYLSSGATLDAGVLAYGESNMNAANLWRFTLVVRNDGGPTPLVTSVTFQTLQGDGWHQGSNTLLTELGPLQADTTALRLWTDRPGLHRAQMSISHNDPSLPDPFVIHLVAEVKDPPRMTVRDPSGVELSSGATLDWATLDFGAENNPGGGWRLIPDVVNSSSGTALVTSLALTHSQGNGFSVGGNSLASPLAAGARDEFVLRLDTSRPGTHLAQLHIHHDDPTQASPFVIHLSGTVRAAPAVEMRHGSNNVLLTDEVLDFGSYDPDSGTKNRAITVANIAPLGATGLEWGPVALTHVQGSAFTWGGILESPLAPGASDNFRISFSTAAPGTHKALVEVWHSDPSVPNPHRFYVQATMRTPQTSTFPAIADAWVRQDIPHANYGGASYLYARSASGGLGQSAYMKFNVSGVGPIVSAKLRVRVSGPLQSSRIYWLTDTSWNEYAITWDNAPLDFVLQRETGNLGTGWHEIDVSDIVRFGGLYTLGFAAADAPGQAFFSRDSGASNAPQLIVTHLQ